jgi:dienelactone hydrolase
MGEVYRARDSRLQRDVAVKLLPPDALHDEGARARFRREGLALAKLSHPNVATLYDIGEKDDASYLVMECVAGRSLASMLASGPLPIDDVVALGIEVADALAEAHEHGIVHRDLKPANVMITPRGHAKVLDFGIAKLLAPPEGDRATLTETGGAIGTLAYMSPEQALGEPIDYRTDLWSLGVLLYESLTGAPPFQGAGTLGTLQAISSAPLPPLRDLRPDVPVALERIIERALAKEPAQRQQSAAELARELAAARAPTAGTTSPDRRQKARSIRRLVPLVVGVLLVGGIGAWRLHRFERRHWAIEQAIPQAAQLTADHPLAAYRLLRAAERYVPGDSQLTALLRGATRTVSVTSTPSAATVEIQDYTDPDSDWYPLGTTPMHRITVPAGYFRWRVTTAGAPPTVIAPVLEDSMHFALDSARAAPNGMVYIGGRAWGDFIAFLGWVGPYQLPPFYVDRYEVTNRDFQRFVDAGGYERRDYWREPFVDGDGPLDWSEAMSRLRDSTGRAGPSTWKGGHFQEGRGDYPVSGVSWYEARAYAEWAGKTLPTMAQWYSVAPASAASFTVRESNISRDGIAVVGTFHGVGPFGTYDMAGNVREWILNQLGGNRRLILGGAWSSPSYLYSEPEALSPFDRSATNGFRCVRNLRPLPPAALAAITPLERDFARFTPASDAVFDAYRVLYSYDRGPLESRADAVLHDGGDWREERVSFTTAYDGRRMTAYLFLPKHARPPYQTVVFFPSARVLELPSSSSALGDTSFFDYVVQSGRAVLYPIYQGTYERPVRDPLPGASQRMTLTVQRYQDVARSLDYLWTRPDIDTTRVAYLGVSMGAAEGVIYTTLLQDRLRTDVFLDGGYFLDKPSPGRDQADFAPRLRIPVLMVNGRYDFSFSLDRAQLPLFRMLGTPATDKRHVVLETPHDVRARRPELIREVVGWLDHYLGPVR